MDAVLTVIGAFIGLIAGAFCVAAADALVDRMMQLTSRIA